MVEKMKPFLTSQMVAVLLFLMAAIADVAAVPEIESKVITMNTALIDSGNGIVGAQEREAALISELIGLNPEAICLQEVVSGPSVQRIVQALGAAGYTSSLSALHESPTWVLPDQTAIASPPCPPELSTLIPMINAMCSVLPGTGLGEYIQCIVSNFLSDIIALGQKCIVCIGTAGPLSTSLAFCSSTPVDINLPGLLLLSKRPMSNQAVVNFHNVTTLTPRYYLAADIEGLGRTICTHLTPLSVTVPYVEPFLASQGITTSAEQNLFQVDTLVKSLIRYGEVTLMGDLNTSPDEPLFSVTSQFPDSWELLTRKCNRLKCCLVPCCTFCRRNRWNRLRNQTRNILIDHVFVKGLHITSCRRVLDANRLVRIQDLSNRRYPLSDHFGVESCIKRPAKSDDDWW